MSYDDVIKSENMVSDFMLLFIEEEKGGRFL